MGRERGAGSLLSLRGRPQGSLSPWMGAERLTGVSASGLVNICDVLFKKKIKTTTDIIINAKILNTSPDIGYR